MSGSATARFKNARRRKIAVVAVILAAFLALSVAAYFLPPDLFLRAYAIPQRREGEMRIHYLDVGQGDCSVIEFPDGEILIVDAGDGSTAHCNKIVRYLKGLAPTSVTMVLTHADSDHYGGFARLLKTFGADRFFLPVLKAEEAAYLKLLATVERAGSETGELTRYATLTNASGAYVVCLSPYSIDETDGNESSTVLYLSYGGVNAVFCGDISAARERRLVREYALDESLFDSNGYSVRLSETDILKVAHHGSAYSSSQEWISLLNAQTAVVSCGRGNAYSHPSDEALNRLSDSEIYRTDELGDVVVGIYQGEYSVYTNYTKTAREG